MKNIRINLVINKFLLIISVIALCVSCELTSQSKIEIFTEFYDSGCIKSKSVLKDSVLFGYCIEFYETGSIKLECVYNNGVLNGPFNLFHENGLLKREGIWENNLAIGIHTFYDIEGNIEKKGSFENGIPNGIWEIYIEGKLGQKVIYKDGIIIQTLIDNHIIPAPPPANRSL